MEIDHEPVSQFLDKLSCVYKMKLPRPSFRSLAQPPRKVLPLQQRCGITQTAYQRPHRDDVSRPRRSYGSVVSAANVQFGQPVHETHPHILKAGECEFTLFIVTLI